MSDESYDSGKDFFSIGSSAKDCQIKVYFNDEEEAIKKIDMAIKLYNNAKQMSRRS